MGATTTTVATGDMNMYNMAKHQQFLYPTPPQEQLHNNSFSPASPDQWSSASPHPTVNGPMAQSIRPLPSTVTATILRRIINTNNRCRNRPMRSSSKSNLEPCFKGCSPPILPLDLMCNLVVF